MHTHTHIYIYMYICIYIIYIYHPPRRNKPAAVPLSPNCPALRPPALRREEERERERCIYMYTCLYTYYLYTVCCFVIDKQPASFLQMFLSYGAQRAEERKRERERDVYICIHVYIHTIYTPSAAS